MRGVSRIKPLKFYLNQASWLRQKLRKTVLFLKKNPNTKTKFDKNPSNNTQTLTTKGSKSRNNQKSSLSH